MDEITTATKDDAQATDQTSSSEKESTSKTPKTYTEKEYSDALSEQGRRLKSEQLDPLTKERDTFKSQAEQAQREATEATVSLRETETKIGELETDLEEAIGEDGDLRDIKEIKTKLRAERDKARLEAKDERGAIAELKKTAEAEREEWAGTVAEAQVFKFDGELAKVVDEYEGDVTANLTKLKDACDKAGIKTKEGAEAIAEIIWTKKVEEPDMVNDSGVTIGSGGGIPTNMEQFRKWVAGLSQSEYEEKAAEVNKMMKQGEIT